MRNPSLQPDTDTDTAQPSTRGHSKRSRSNLSIVLKLACVLNSSWTISESTSSNMFARAFSTPAASRSISSRSICSLESNNYYYSRRQYHPYYHQRQHQQQKSCHQPRPLHMSTISPIENIEEERRIVVEDGPAVVASHFLQDGRRTRRRRSATTTTTTNAKNKKKSVTLVSPSSVSSVSKQKKIFKIQPTKIVIPKKRSFVTKVVKNNKSNNNSQVAAAAAASASASTTETAATVPGASVTTTTAYNKNINHSNKSNNRKKASKRLTREEEVRLTKAIRDLKSVINIRDELSAALSLNNPDNSKPSYIPNPMYKEQSGSLPYASQPMEKEWARACDMPVMQLRRILVAGREARRQIVDANIGLTTQIAKRYIYELQRSVKGNENIGTILTLADLIQEGNLGLMEAAERFEAERGVTFATYAVYWVRSRILRSIADNSRVIRLPAHVHTTLRSIRKAKAEMQKEIGREPSMPELAHHLQIPLSKLQLYTDSSLPTLSLESPIGGGNTSSKAGSGEADKRTLGERIASDSPTPVEDAELKSLRSDIFAAIDGLGNDRERDVLLNRFGLEDGTPQTLEETANKLNISRDRVRSLEARALNKLRHPQRNHMLKEYVRSANGDDPHRLATDNDDTRNDRRIDFFRPNGGGKEDVKKYGDDTLSQLTPESIWSF